VDLLERVGHDLVELGSDVLAARHIVVDAERGALVLDRRARNIDDLLVVHLAVLFVQLVELFWDQPVLHRNLELHLNTRFCKDGERALKLVALAALEGNVLVDLGKGKGRLPNAPKVPVVFGIVGISWNRNIVGEEKS
jgi:hypothetical protein